MVGAPNGAVDFVDLPRCRQEGGRTVVLRPVELDTTRHPRPGEPDQCRLDHGVGVEEWIVGAFVHCELDPATQLRQDQQPQVRVLQMQPHPRAVRTVLADPVVERQRINPAGRALVDPTVQVGGVAVGGFGEIGGEDYRLAPRRDRPVSEFCWPSRQIERTIEHV